MSMKETQTYAVFWANEDIGETWRRYGGWHCRIEEAEAELALVRQYARFKHTKIVQKVETYKDMEEGEHEMRGR